MLRSFLSLSSCFTLDPCGQQAFCLWQTFAYPCKGGRICFYLQEALTFGWFLFFAVWKGVQVIRQTTKMRTHEKRSNLEVKGVTDWSCWPCGLGRPVPEPSSRRSWGRRVCHFSYFKATSIVSQRWNADMWSWWRRLAPHALCCESVGLVM